MSSEVFTEDPLIGQTLAHYRILEKIGSGGMGVVYRAHDIHLDREVAIKLLPLRSLATDQARRHFRREALTLSKLNHPNIATIYDFDTQNELDFLVMEYISGVNLKDKITAASLSEKQVLALSIQLAEGLAAAHEHSIVHRDLKPANLRLTPHGRLKILDFGLAKLWACADSNAVSETLSETRDMVGTLPYMAPEQVLGGDVDARTDIHATGAVLYEMATGLRAFPAADHHQLANEILRSSPRPPSALNPRLSPELARIITKCLERDPDDRYQSAKELCIDLRRLQTVNLSGVQPAVITVPRRSTRTIYVALLALALILSLLLVVKFDSVRALFLGGGAPRIDSLAVLPLVNLSGDPQQDYFADGMTEELITNLGKIAALRVISRTSTMQYKHTSKSLPTIASELNVDAVVEGSVLRSGDRVRITAKLIRAKSDRQLWAETYERNSSDILGLQSDVAHAIASQVRVNLTPLEQRLFASVQQVNPAAHEAYMRGRYHALKTTEDELGMARSFFEQAIVLDPQYAPPYVGLADYYVSTDELSPQQALSTAQKFAEKALALDETLADAHLSLGDIQNGMWNRVEADRQFKSALELNPSFAEAHRRYANFLASLGRDQEAALEIRTAQDLDPFSSLMTESAGWVAYFSRHFIQARDTCQHVLESDPDNVNAFDCLGSTYLAMGDYDQAITACQKAASLSGNDPPRVICLGQTYAVSGKTDQARLVLKGLYRASHQKYIPPYFFALLHSSLGENDKALAALDKACRQHDLYLVWARVSPAADLLRSDPRSAELLRQFGPSP